MRGIFRPTATLPSMLLYQGVRSLTFSHSRQAVDKALLSKLRKQTGIPFINCKKALEKYENDFDQAKQWLQEQAQKEGWARATKLQTRPMSQGLVAVISNQKQATLLEVNCETDFVARNEKFVNMVTKLVQDCNSHLASRGEKWVNLNQEELNQVKSSSEGGTLSDVIALNVGNLGENMALRRAAFLQASGNSLLFSYVHPSSGPGKDGQSIRLGKYGAVVELQPMGDGAESQSASGMMELGSHLCQHIVGMNPKSVGVFSSGAKKLPESIRLKDDASSESDSDKEGNESKPAAAGQEQEEEGELLSQEFLLDSSITVGELAHVNGVDVKGFVRFACGQDLETESEQ